ncbi:hypothetical protein OTU49_002795, partial [Cherax quadricarinatus]
GKVKMLVAQLDTPIVDSEAKKARKDLLVNYFTLNLHSQNMYAFKFFICEALNFVNIIGQMYLTNRFLGYEFSTYGTRVINFSKQELGTRHDPMDEVFPKVAKCTFYKYGATASHEKFDGLCVLPLNVVSEKIFIFLWFWFIIVAVCSALGVVYRLTTFVPMVRNVILRVQARLSDRSTVECVTHNCQIGDWFLLYQLGKNMDPLIYKEFIFELANSLQKNAT